MGKLNGCVAKLEEREFVRQRAEYRPPLGFLPVTPNEAEAIVDVLEEVLSEQLRLYQNHGVTVMKSERREAMAAMLESAGYKLPSRDADTVAQTYISAVRRTLQEVVKR